MSAETPQASTSVPIADPGPLGLAAFAMTTFLLSTFNAGLLSDKLSATFLTTALFYGGIVQVLAGMWEFRKNNTFGALAFSSYGAFWLSFYGLVKDVVPTLVANDPGEVDKAIGLFLLGWTIFTLYMTLAAVRTSTVLTLVFAALSLTFIALTIAKFGGNANLGKVGGYLGLLTAALAWYASAAGVARSTWGRAILPTGAR